METVNNKQTDEVAEVMLTQYGCNCFGRGLKNAYAMPQQNYSMEHFEEDLDIFVR